MFFALAPEQQLLQESVRGFAAEHSNESAVRRSMADPTYFDAAAWTRLAVEVGVVTLGSGGPGGAGGDLVDTAAILHVLGEHLYPGPYLSSVLAAHVLAAAAPGDTSADCGPGLVAGSTLVSAVWAHAPGDGVEVADGQEGPALTGTFATVLDAGHADQLLLADASGSWYQVNGDAPGLERTHLPAFDQTRRLARLTLTATPARPIALSEPTDALLSRVATLERIAVAAESVGVARHALDTAVEYAKERKQFGHPIGSFQALKHWFADTALSVECAWAAAFEAAWNFDHRPEAADRSSYLAAAAAGDVSLAAAELMLQVHGGVGFTWDNPSHLYLKRAKSNRMLWGHPDEHRRRLGDLLDL